MKFVDVTDYGFITEPRYYFYGWSNSSKIMGRESAVEALVQAQRELPCGYNFKIWDCRRPRSVQLAMLNSFRRRFRVLYPWKPKAVIEKMVFTFGARPLKIVTRLDTHRNGGSFDLTIVNDNGYELYMGTDHDDLSKVAATDYFEKKENLSPREKEAKKNRRLLKKVLLKTGFINYAPEWWHWSWNY